MHCNRQNSLKQPWPQEWWGITDCIKRQAEYVAEKTGYQVLVPDLYKGKLGVDAEEASHSKPAPAALLASSNNEQCHAAYGSPPG